MGFLKTFETADVTASNNITQVGGVSIPAASSTKSATTPVLVVQNIDASGNIATSGGAATTTADYKSPSDFAAAFATANTITLTNLPTAIATPTSEQIVYIRVIPVSGDSKVYVNGASNIKMTISGSTITLAGTGAPATPFVTGDRYEVGINGSVSVKELMLSEMPTTADDFISPFMGGNVVYASSTTLTASGFPFTVDSANCMIRFISWVTAGGVIKKVVNGMNGVSITASSDTISVSGFGTPFLNTDTQYYVSIRAPKVGVDYTSDSNKITMLNPSYSQYIDSIVLINSTNVATGTNYYPSSDGLIIDGFKDVSIQANTAGTGASVVTTTFEVSDETDSPTRWLDCTKAGYVSGGSLAGTVGNVSFIAASSAGSDFKIDFDGMNAKRMRVKSVTSGAATNTVYYTAKLKGF